MPLLPHRGWKPPATILNGLDRLESDTTPSGGLGGILGDLLILTQLGRKMIKLFFLLINPNRVYKIYNRDKSKISQFVSFKSSNSLIGSNNNLKNN
jgi:hypothetical protein